MKKIPLFAQTTRVSQTNFNVTVIQLRQIIGHTLTGQLRGRTPNARSHKVANFVSQSVAVVVEPRASLELWLSSHISAISTDTICNKKVIILLQQSTFRGFAAKYYHFFYWKWYQLIFAVIDVSLWALTTVVKLPWKFLTLIDVINVLGQLSQRDRATLHVIEHFVVTQSKVIRNDTLE